MAAVYEKLSQAFFPVELRDIFVHGESKDEEKQARLDMGASLKKVPGFQAVFCRDNGHAFSVVSDKYRLVTNHKAYKLGQECFKQVFSITEAKDMEFFSLVMPKSRSFCHINFIHKNRPFSPVSDEDKWFPFLRVTNSYNRTYALAFDLGFCRNACKNGVFFGKRSINFKCNHNRKTDQLVWQFSLRAGAFDNMENAFVESLHNLKRYWVPEKMMWPLVAKVYGLQTSGFKNERQEQIFADQKERVRGISRKYCQMMGENGYTALNVISDFATKPVGYISDAQKVDGFQRKTGDWIGEFLKAIESRDFSFENYLEDYAQLVA